VLKGLIHISVAISLFISFGGFWTNSHFCQLRPVKTNIILNIGSYCPHGSAPHCASEKTSCPKKHREEGANQGCCTNTLNYHRLEQNRQFQEIEYKSFVSNFTSPAINPLLPALNKHAAQYSHYSPPLIVYDRQVRFQSFLS
jgi:hypothetical protein